MKGILGFSAYLEKKADAIGEKMKDKAITVPTDMIGAALFIALGIILLALMPGQAPVSEADVVNGRVFPAILIGLMIVCCVLLLIQNGIKLMKKEPLHTCTINLLTEVKALVILTILIVTYFICKWTGLFAAGAVFCAFAFLVYFRCKKKLYYVVTIGLAVLIWAAFRYGLGVRF